MKLCECGCGLPAPIATGTDRTKGWVRGEPKRFISKHSIKLITGRKGEKSSHWKGGRHIENGYVFIFKPEHPRANSGGYVQEHVLIAEHALGRPLPLKSEVHHANEQRGDNENHNLVICEDRTYHCLLHRRKRAVDAGVPPHWLPCVLCHAHDAPENLYVVVNGPLQQWHRACRNKYDKERRRHA